MLSDKTKKRLVDIEAIAREAHIRSDQAYKDGKLITNLADTAVLWKYVAEIAKAVREVEIS